MREVLGLVTANLQPALAGCGTAIQRFLAAGTAGAIVNVSSHQAQRPVRSAPVRDRQGRDREGRDRRPEET